MDSKSDKARLAVLKALDELNEPAGASRIMAQLASAGTTLQPRTIRFYLLQLDSEGLTRCISRRQGRVITPAGKEELAHANVLEKVGFIAAKVDTLGYRMSFNTRSSQGTIITNLATIDEQDIESALKVMAPVFSAGLGMGRKIVTARAGEVIAGFTVPGNSVAIGTVCSVTVNGTMLADGVPVTSRFGGLLEMKDGEPMRFVELIEYSGTTIDPLETFINAGMTQVTQCATTGSGVIGASLREVPSAAIADVKRVGRDMDRRGLGGILALGIANRPLLDIPVAEGRAGMIVVGGLNPVAALHEAGLGVTMQSLAGLEDVGTFSTFNDIVTAAG